MFPTLGTDKPATPAAQLPRRAFDLYPAAIPMNSPFAWMNRHLSNVQRREPMHFRFRHANSSQKVSRTESMKSVQIVIPALSPSLIAWRTYLPMMPAVSMHFWAAVVCLITLSSGSASPKSSHQRSLLSSSSHPAAQLHAARCAHLCWRLRQWQGYRRHYWWDHP